MAVTCFNTITTRACGATKMRLAGEEVEPTRPHASPHVWWSAAKELERFMFHILLLNKQRAPKTTSAGNLNPPHHCQPGPLRAASGAETSSLETWIPLWKGDPAHHTGRGSGCFHAAPRKRINLPNQVKGHASVDNMRGNGAQTWCGSFL